MSEHLPGGEILEHGLRNLGVGVRSISALLAAEQGPEAYRLYRSLLRRLVSLENALDIGPDLFPNTAPRKAINAS